MSADTLLRAVAVLLAAGAGAAAFAFPPRSFGDAGEYLLITESWFRHGSPALRPADVSALRELGAGRSPAVGVDAALGNYFEARDGRRYCYHFWAYSLLGVPARAALERLGGDPLRALPLTNAALLAGALAAVLLGLPWPPGRRLVLGGLLVLSPALGFLLWPHPETLSFALVSLALVARERGETGRAVLAAALASLQNPPLVVLVGFLWAGAAVPALRAGHLRPVGRATLGALPALASPAFFLGWFGVANLSVRPGEALESLSALRAPDLLFDLNLGMVRFLPIALALFLGLAARELVRGRPGPGAPLTAVLLATAWACTANSNWNNGTTGPSRYVAWLAPLVLFAVAHPASALPGRQGRVLLLAAVVLQGVVTIARGAFLSPYDYLEHSRPAQAVLERWPRLYAPAHEVFAERTLGHERGLEDLVVYRRDGRCRKALARWRHGRELEEACGPHPPARAAFFAGRPEGRDARRAWVYVDY